MKNFIKKFIPKFLLSWYHLVLAHLANFIYGNPSKNLIVIGVTGTNGKSTTVNLIAKILEQAGHKVVISSTVNFKVGEREWLNNLKMTMPGRLFIQKLLGDGVKAGCKFAVIESSSEGILQHRHIGVHYDAMVFTNLTPEHIEAHGGFENYKKAKLEYFRHLEQLPHKTINGQKTSKIIAVNADDSAAEDFLKFDVDQKITYGQSKGDIRGTNLQVSEQGIKFQVGDTDFSLNLKGIFDIYNALGAIALTSRLAIDLKLAKVALEQVQNVPGRMELIDEGQNFKIVIDYAPEPEGLKQLYATVKHWQKNKIIHVLGSTGGGRDTARRKILGNIAGTNADQVVVTNEDPYDDDPSAIIHEVAAGAEEVGKIVKKDLWRAKERRDGIRKALTLAGPGDLVLITGKGSEQKMAVRGGYIPWDDRQVVREEILKNIYGISNNAASKFIVEFENKFKDYLDPEQSLDSNKYSEPVIKTKYFAVCRASAKFSDWDLHCWVNNKITPDTLMVMSKFIYSFPKFSAMGHMLTFSENEKKIWHDISRVKYVQFMGFTPNESSAPFVDIHIAPTEGKREIIAATFQKPFDDRLHSWLLITYWRKLLAGNQQKIAALTPYLKDVFGDEFESITNKKALEARFAKDDYYSDIYKFLTEQK